MLLNDIFGIQEALYKLLIDMVAGIYQIVNFTYQIFITLAKNNIFDNSSYNEIIKNVYIILGVVMLFVVAYNILNLVVDPDKNKGGKAVEQLIKKIVISFILVIFCPTIFNFAFDLSGAIVEGNVINQIFLGESADGDGETIQEEGRRLAVDTFLNFFYPQAYEASNADLTSIENSDITNLTKIGKYSYSGGEADCSKEKSSTCTLAIARKVAIENGQFHIFTAFAKNIFDDSNDDKIVKFDFLISLAAGIYLAYCIVSFCFDLAVRAAKLFFYEIIAPICITCQIVPRWESIYKNWTKNVVQTYLSLFTRMLILSLGLFLMTKFSTTSLMSSENVTFAVKVVANAFIILGIMTFVRQAPKLLDDIFGLNMAGSLGIKDKIKASSAGAFVAGAGAGATSLVRSGVMGFGKTAAELKGWKGMSGKERVKAGFSAAGRALEGVGSTVRNTVSSSYYGAKDGSKATSWKEMKTASSKAVEKTETQADIKDNYRANAQLGKLKGTIPIVGGIAVAASHLKDTGKDLARWAGFNDIKTLISQNQQFDTLKKAVDNVTDTAKKAITSDAAKGKQYDYGITARYQQKISYRDKSGTLQTVDFSTLTASDGGKGLNYNSEMYHAIEQGISAAKANRREKFSLNGITLDTSAWENVLGSYLAEMGKEVANSAALNTKDWKDPSKVSEKVRRQLSSTREAYESMMNTFEANSGSELISFTNDLPDVTGDKLNVSQIRNTDVKFNKDSAVSHIADGYKELHTRNATRIDQLQKEEKK